MQINNIRTFQQIYDFCLTDRTYNEYYNIPDHFQCKSREQYRYYYNNLSRRGQCRAGTYIYSQSRKQLERFLNNQQQDFYFHVNEETFEEVDYQKFEGKMIYIVAHIRGDGVHIQYTHPYKCSYESNLVFFTARSHIIFDKQGLIKEMRNHFNKTLLYPPGRYCDLQLEYRIAKEKFVEWYKYEYRWMQERKHEREYREMVEAYTLQEPETSWDDCYNMLGMVGAFDDFGYDNDSDRYQMTDQLYNMCNR